MRRGLLLLLIVSTGLACTAPPSSGGPAGPSATQPTVVVAPNTAAWETAMLQRINAERAAAGAGALVTCRNLRTAAAAHSADQAGHSTMSHTGSDGSTMVQRAERAGYTSWTNLGENVAYGYATVDAVMTAWMSSPGHRANLLNGAFTHVGLGQAAASNGTLYWTQDFGRSGNC